MNYFSKTDRIIEICKGRRVLHIGCVGFADLQTDERVSLAKKSLHYALSNCADTIGVDYSAEAINYYKSQKIFNNVTLGNAEALGTLNLVPDFDIIVAGDIIEHLSNPGNMLDGIRALCNENTIVIITTPHAFGLMAFMRHLGNRFKEGQEHVFTMNTQNIETLAKRHGFRIERIDTCHQDTANNGALFQIGRQFFRKVPKLGGTIFAILRPKT